MHLLDELQEGPTNVVLSCFDAIQARLQQEDDESNGELVLSCGRLTLG